MQSSAFVYCDLFHTHLNPPKTAPTSSKLTIGLDGALRRWGLCMAVIKFLVY